MAKKLIRYTQSPEEFNEMVKKIASLCSIPSISEYSKNAEYPFGIECNKALNYTLKLAKEFGFKIHKDPGKMYGFAQIGEGDKIIAILAHLDVVPEGNSAKWLTTNAFLPIKNATDLYARGSVDDKGPTIVNLYAMKYIKDHNLLKDDWAIRLVFGLSEETSMLSMKTYLHDFGEPLIAYTPDGCWPVVYAEKLIYHINLWFPAIEGLAIEAGKVVNQIPDSIYVQYPNIEKLQDKFPEGETKYEPKLNILKVNGTSGHGSDPASGTNAILKFFKEFIKAEPKLKNNALFKFFSQNFSDENDFSLKEIFPNYEDHSGKLTANLGMIRTIPGYYVLSFDLRVPVTFTKSNIFSDLSKYISTLNKKIHIEPISTKSAKVLDRNDKLVTILMDTYNEYHKTSLEPIAMGAGTYARLFDNCVAFGATNDVKLMHASNERYSFKEMKESLEIYINALYRLQDYFDN